MPNIFKRISTMQNPPPAQFSLRVFCPACSLWLEFPQGAHAVMCSECKKTIVLNEEGNNATDRCSKVGNWCERNLSRPAGFFVFSISTLLTCSIVGLGFTFLLPALILPDCFLGVLAWCWSLLLTLNVAFNFVVVVFIHPGSPSPFSPLESKTRPGDEEDSQTQAQQWCVKCNNVKPEGTHHCSTCRTCISQMDHHCLFINNCVGERNFRYFLLYLFWVALSTAYVLVLCVLTFFYVDEVVDMSGLVNLLHLRDLVSVGFGTKKPPVPSLEVKLAYSVAPLVAVLSIGVCVGVSLLLGYTVRLFASGLTTLDAMRPLPQHTEQSRTPQEPLMSKLKVILCQGPSTSSWWFLSAVLPKAPSRVGFHGNKRA